MNPNSSNPDPVNPFKPDPFREPIDNSATNWPLANKNSAAPVTPQNNKPSFADTLPGAMPADDALPVPAPAPKPDITVSASVPAFVPPAPQPINIPRPTIVPPSEPKIIFKAPAPSPMQQQNVQPPTQGFVPRPSTPTIPKPPAAFMAPPLAPKMPIPMKPPQPIQTSQQQPSSATTQTAPEAKAPNPVLKNIRTYESDVADVLAHRGTTRASMIIAENVKRGEGDTIANSGPFLNSTGPLAEQQEKTHLVRNLILVILSIVLVGAGVIAGYYLYSQSPVGAKVPTMTHPKTPPAIIHYESQAVISTDSLVRSDIIKKVRIEMAKPMPASTIKEIVFTESKDEQTFRVSAPEMAHILILPVPDIMLRTLTPDWMLGVYSSPDTTKTAFAIVSTNLFQNAFAGMLGWEAALPEDLKDILSTIDAKTFTPAIKGTFRDQIVRNKDVRAFVTDNDQTALVYSFVDNSTLVVAANNEALAAVIARLESKAFVR